MNDAKAKTFVCYLLESLSEPNVSYIGYTIDLKRRIRQHNGLIKKGAKYTSSRGPFRIVAYVGPFHDKRFAQKFEWAWKNAQKSKLLKPFLDQPQRRPVGARARLEVLTNIKQFFIRHQLRVFKSVEQ
jgi:structure-specific endonuclease subunit SLX1